MGSKNSVVLNADKKAAINNEIWEAIHYYEAVEEDYIGIVNSCGMKKEELKSLKTALVQMNTDLESRQQLRREAAAAVGQLPDILVMGTVFSQEMGALLDGAQYRSVCDGIESAIERIDQQTAEINEEIEYYQSWINTLGDVRRDLYNRLQ